MLNIKSIKQILALLVLLFSAVHVHAVDNKKVLILVSNVIDMGDIDKHDARNNLWEVAPPFHIFTSHGFTVDFASPTGKKVEFMMDPLGISSYAIKYENFLEKVDNSLNPMQIKAEEYWAVFIGGGYGPLFDIANNKELLNIIAKIYQNGGIIGASGHGAGAFANVVLNDGSFMVEGKRIAGFPNSTEKSKSWAKQGTLLPFLVESQLLKNGANALNKEKVKNKHDVIIDQRIVTTMFLPSAALVAKEMIELQQVK